MSPQLPVVFSILRGIFTLCAVFLVVLTWHGFNDRYICWVRTHSHYYINGTHRNVTCTKWEIYQQPKNESEDLYFQVSLSALELVVEKIAGTIWDTQTFQDLRTRIGDSNIRRLVSVGMLATVIPGKNFKKQGLTGVVGLEKLTRYKIIQLTQFRHIRSVFLSWNRWNWFNRFSSYLDRWRLGYTSPQYIDVSNRA